MHSGGTVNNGVFFISNFRFGCLADNATIELHLVLALDNADARQLIVHQPTLTIGTLFGHFFNFLTFCFLLEK